LPCNSSARCQQWGQTLTTSFEDLVFNNQHVICCRAGELRLISAGEVRAAVEQRKDSGQYGRLVTADVSDDQEKVCMGCLASI
jgi:hypothetical protein